MTDLRVGHFFIFERSGKVVQKKLPTINSAHGSETRNIINELIKLFNNMGYTYDEALQKAHDVLSEAQKTNDINKDVQQQINTLIVESGTSDAEVLQARVDAEGNTYTTVKERLDAKDYKSQEDVQNLESDINEKLNDKVNHRPVHVNSNGPTSAVGSNGDIYVQTYNDNEPRFYEEGEFTPELRTSPMPTGIVYNEQSGSFIRIGNAVTVTFTINVQTLGTGSSGFHIGTLPYSATEIQSFGVGEVTNFTLSNNEVLDNLFLTVGNTISLRKRNTTTNATSGISYSDLDDGFRMFITFTYIADVGDFHD